MIWMLIYCLYLPLVVDMPESADLEIQHVCSLSSLKAKMVCIGVDMELIDITKAYSMA